MVPIPTVVLLWMGLSLTNVVGLLGAITIVAVAVVNARFAWVVFSLAMFANRFAIPIGPAVLRFEHLALVLLVVSVLAARRTGQRQALGRVLPVVVVFGAWVLLSAVTSGASAPEPVRSLYIVMLYVLAFAAFVMARASEDAVWRVQSSMTVLSVLSTFSVISWVFAENTSIITRFVILNNYEDTHRTQGLFFEPNFLGSACAIWLCLLYAYRKHFLRRALFFHSVILASALLLSLTRAAWVAVVLVTVVVLVKALRRRPGLVVAFCSLAAPGIAILVSVLPAAATEEISRRIRGLFDFSSGTGRFRADGWGLALEQLTQNNAWLFGLGTNSYSQRNVSTATSSGEAYLGNFWLGLLYDTGVIGFALMILLIGLIIAISSSRMEMWLLIAVVVLVSFATSPLWFAYPWVAIGLMQQGASSGGGESHRSQARERTPTQIVPIRGQGVN